MFWISAIESVKSEWGLQVGEVAFEEGVGRNGGEIVVDEIQVHQADQLADLHGDGVANVVVFQNEWLQVH